MRAIVAFALRYATLLCSILLPASAASAAAPPFTVVAISGAVAPSMQPGQLLDPTAELTLDAGSAITLAFPCGALIVLEGPRRGTPAEIGMAAGATEPCGQDVAPRVAQRRALVLSLMEPSPERVLRAAHGKPPDVLDLDLDSPSPSCFLLGRAPSISGDGAQLGEALDIHNETTGDHSLAYYDNASQHWAWPDDLPVAAGSYVIETRLREIKVELKALDAPLPDDPTGRALILSEAGCRSQARRLLDRLPPEFVVRAPK
jgi:hypothetical protein